MPWEEDAAMKPFTFDGITFNPETISHVRITEWEETKPATTLLGKIFGSLELETKYAILVTTRSTRSVYKSGSESITWRFYTDHPEITKSQFIREWTEAMQ